MTRTTSALLFTSLAILSTNCIFGSDDDDDGQVAAERQSFAAEYCQLAQPCCAGLGYSGTACEGQIAARVPLDFDPASGRACLDAIRAGSGREDFCGWGMYLGLVDACAVLGRRGDVPVGGKCHNAVTGVECAPSAEGKVACIFGDGGSICQVQALALTEGDACDADSNDDGTLPAGESLSGGPARERGAYCDRSRGLYCDYETTRTCLKQTPAGAACPLSVACAVGTYCSFDPKVCTPLGADGAACVGDVTCASTYCDKQTKRCSNKGSPEYLGPLCGQ
jgi:hypothetical protein